MLALWSAASTHPTITDTSEDLARLIDEQPGAVLVAELDGRLVGSLIAAWDGWRANLYRLAVADEAAVAFWDSLESRGLVPDPSPKARYIWNLLSAR